MKITGNTLIELGYTPAKWFGEALEVLNNSNGRELTEEDIRKVAEELKPEPIKVINPFEVPVEYIRNIVARTEFEEDNLAQVEATMNEVMKTPTVVTGAIMPDSCPTGQIGQIPVGGVVVAKNAIHPAMHSADICCSMFATNFGKTDPKTVLDMAFETTQFGAGGRRGLGGWSSLLDDRKDLLNRIESNYFTKDYVEKARLHLGTQGDGNHFLFVGKSKETGDTWMVTHHGSRGFGAKVYKKGLHSAENYRRKHSPETLKTNAWIPYDSEEGRLYWEALQLVREWTKLNHSSIHQKIANGLKVAVEDTFWNEHNFVFKKGDLFYHAKGATPLTNEFVPDSQNGLRLIPLNMSEPILVVKGEETETNLGFAPHGAGRNMSRAAHKRLLVGKSDEEIYNEETKGLDVRFYSGKIDISELPTAYKNAENVKSQIEEFGLGTLVDEILPYGCIMAGEQEKPWLK